MAVQSETSSVQSYAGSRSKRPCVPCDHLHIALNHLHTIPFI